MRPDAGSDEVTDVLLTLVGPSTYAMFTRDYGWTHTGYVDWATRALGQLLLWDSPLGHAAGLKP